MQELCKKVQIEPSSLVVLGNMSALYLIKMSLRM